MAKIVGMLAAIVTLADNGFSADENPDMVNRHRGGAHRALDLVCGDVAKAGYPRVIGYAPGTGIYGEYVVGADAPGAPPRAAMVHPATMAFHPAAPGQPPPVMIQPPAPQPIAIQSPPWRPMMAPGSPPLGEGHVPMPLNPETFGGTWGGAAGAPAGTTITFSARPQKPFKATRVLISATKSGPTAIGRLVGQTFVGTDLQQGELGNVDLESLGAGGSFDTWISFKQAEPGVWLRVQGTLTAFPTAPDFETYIVTAIGHYLH